MQDFIFNSQEDLIAEHHLDLSEVFLSQLISIEQLELRVIPIERYIEKTLTTRDADKVSESEMMKLPIEARTTLIRNALRTLL
jgi:hypothetical protein